MSDSERTQERDRGKITHFFKKKKTCTITVLPTFFFFYIKKKEKKKTFEMGITDLWKLLEQSERRFSLEQLSSYANKNGKSLRVAIDVALWSFQVRASVVGE